MMGPCTASPRLRHPPSCSPGLAAPAPPLRQDPQPCPPARAGTPHLMGLPVLLAVPGAGLLVVLADVHHLRLGALPDEVPAHAWYVLEAVTCRRPGGRQWRWAGDPQSSQPCAPRVARVLLLRCQQSRAGAEEAYGSAVTESPVPRPRVPLGSQALVQAAPPGSSEAKRHPPPWESPSCKSPGAGEHAGTASPPYHQLQLPWHHFPAVLHAGWHPGKGSPVLHPVSGAPSAWHCQTHWPQPCHISAQFSPCVADSPLLARPPGRRVPPTHSSCSPGQPRPMSGPPTRLLASSGTGPARRPSCCRSAAARAGCSCGAPAAMTWQWGDRGTRPRRWLLPPPNIPPPRRGCEAGPHLRPKLLLCPPAPP